MSQELLPLEPSAQALAVEESAFDVGMLDASSPRSLINIVPERFRHAILAVPLDMLEQTETELLAQFALRGYKPTPTDHRLRINFWSEYQRAQNQKLPLTLTQIYRGICSREYFYAKFLDDRQRMAWLLCAPADYMHAMNEALTFGIERLRNDILTMPVMSGGRPDPKVAAVIVEAVKMLDMRVKGASVQKLQHLHAHVHKKSGDQPGGAVPEARPSMDQLDQRLKDLEERAAKLNQADFAPVVKPASAKEGAIDVEVVEVSPAPEFAFKRE